jgi:hypothetical protein
MIMPKPTQPAEVDSVSDGKIIINKSSPIAVSEKNNDCCGFI